MNKKGFTIIELVTSLTLAMIIMIFLFNLVFILKDVYIENDKKATLLIEQSAISEEVNTFLYNKNIISVTKCNDCAYCLVIKTSEGEKKLKITDTDSSKKIEFGNYLYKLDSGASFNSIKICYENLDTIDADDNNKILFIDVPISYKGLKGNFGLKSAIPIKRTVTFTDIAHC